MKYSTSAGSSSRMITQLVLFPRRSFPHADFDENFVPVKGEGDSLCLEAYTFAMKKSVAKVLIIYPSYGELQLL